MLNTYTGFGWREHKMNENPFFAYMEALKNENISAELKFEGLERNVPTQPWYKVGINFELWIM